MGCSSNRSGSFAKVDSELFIVGKGEVVGADILCGVFDCMLTDMGDYGIGAHDGDDRAAVRREELRGSAVDKFGAFVEVWVDRWEVLKVAHVIIVCFFASS